MCVASYSLWRRSLGVAAFRLLRVCPCILMLAAAMHAQAVDGIWLRSRLDHNPYLAAQEATQQAQEARSKQDKAALLEALTLIAMAYNLVGDTESAEPSLKEAKSLAAALKDVDAEAMLLAVEGEIEGADNHFEQALKTFEAALAMAKRAGNPGTEALVRSQYGSTLARTMQRHRDAAEHFAAALAYFEKIGSPAREAELRSMSAMLFDRLRDTKHADAERQRALSLIDPNRQAYLASMIFYDRGTAALDMENIPEADAALRRAIELGRSIGDDMGMAFAETKLAEVLIQQGNAPKAISMLLVAIPTLSKGQNTLAAAEGETRLAAGLAVTHKWDAWAALARAKPVLLSSQTPKDESTYWRAEARVAAAFGRFEQAYVATERLRKAQQRLYDDLQAQTLSELSVRYEIQQRNADMLRLQLEQHVKDTTIEAQRVRQLALSGGLFTAVLLLVGGVILLRRQVALKHQFIKLAHHDELTGAPNRRAVMQFAEQVCSQAGYQDPGPLVALLDLDHFKQVNDKYGHPVGDAVLRCFYQAAVGTIRPADMLGRAGGEEWLLVMPEAAPGAEFAVFERIRAAVSAIHPEGLPAEHAITFSMGTARPRHGEGLEQVLKRADLALYEAKQAGRDRLCAM